MESSRPRSVLAAFQEHLQLASSKCGSLMEQLNIVRKKVESEEAIVGVSESIANKLLENVTNNNVLASEEHDALDYKDVASKEKMAADNALAVESSSTMNNLELDVAKSFLIHKTDSQHSHTDKEQAQFLSSERIACVQQERCPVESVDVIDSQCYKDTPKVEKISGKSEINTLLDRGSKSLSQEISSDDDSTSCSSISNDDCKEDRNKENLYEELFRILKVNEEQKFTNKNSSSENSSSTVPRSFKSEKSSKKNQSDCTINEDNFEKKNGEIYNLNTSGVEFFLPSAVTEKFQEIYYEDSCEESQDIYGKDKNTRVTFNDMTTTDKDKKHNLNNGKISETKKLQNLEANKKILTTEFGSGALKKTTKKQVLKRVPNFQQETKIKDKHCDTLSVQTKSESKKSKKLINNSLGMNKKLHSPELSLYKKLNTLPTKVEIKRMSNRKDLKFKKAPIINSKSKSKDIILENNFKNVSEKEIFGTFKTTNPSPCVTEVQINKTKPNKDGGNEVVKKTPFITPKPKNCGEISNGIINKICENKMDFKNPNDKRKDKGPKPIVSNMERGSGDTKLKCADRMKNDTNFDTGKKNSKNQIVKKSENTVDSQEKQHHAVKTQKSFKREHESLPTVILSSEQDSKTPLYRVTQPIKTANKKCLTKHNVANEDTHTANVKVNNNKEIALSNVEVQLTPVKKELSKMKTISGKKEENSDCRNSQALNDSFKTKDQTDKKRKQDLIKDTIYTPNINDMKTLTTTFPFILGQSTSKTYNVRAAIQQTMSMIVKSPAETLRRSSFSDMLNASSKGSTHKSCSSYSSGRKVCPACVIRVDEEEEELDDNPIDPWDTEYHSKRFIRCTCMPRNTVNFKTVMNQLLLETSSSCPVASESYQESELQNGEESRANKSFFRRNNNIYKLSKLLHTLLRIRDLLVT